MNMTHGIALCGEVDHPGRNIATLYKEPLKRSHVNKSLVAGDAFKSQAILPG